jgi:hypothetical protein
MSGILQHAGLLHVQGDGACDAVSQCIAVYMDKCMLPPLALHGAVELKPVMFLYDG